MGACASGSSERSRRQLPVTFCSKESEDKKQQTVENQFIFRLSNICICPVNTKNMSVKFKVDDLQPIQITSSAFQTKPYPNPSLQETSEFLQLKWNKVESRQFIFNNKQLHQKQLSIMVSNNANQWEEIIKINLYLLVHGPYHHNIQIPMNDQSFRILFDAKISHIIEARLKVKQTKINTLERVNFSSCHFTIKAMHEDEVLVRSQPSYPILSNLNPTLVEDQEMERNDTPHKLKLHKTLSIDDSASNNELQWRKRQNSSKSYVMPKIIFDISATQVTKYFLFLTLWSSDSQGTANYICQAKFPLWKMFDKQFASQNLRGTSLSSSTNNSTNDEHLQKRQVSLTQKLYKHQDLFGNCQISIDFATQKMIQQSKYCSRTEKGIVNMRPNLASKSIQSTSKSIQSTSKIIGQLWKMSDQIDQLLHKASQKKTFQRVQSDILSIMTKICNTLATSISQVLYADANKNEQLMNNQNILINIIQKMFPFLQNVENPFISQDCWLIIIEILKRSEFSLQNLSLKGNIKKSMMLIKKQIGLKYQYTLFKLIIYALKGYGLYHNDDSRLSAFLSLIFFRVPLFQKYFFNVIEFQERYFQMQKKLLKYQTEIEPKTSFSNNFAQIKGDWDSNFFNELKQQKQSQQISKQLEQSFRSKRWFMQMSYRDQNMYDFISLLFQCLSKDSAEKANKWKYIEGYSQIVAVILSQLEEKPIDKYTLGLIRSSIQLLENEHLISPLLPLICQKVNVYDSQHVSILLQMLDEYLQMITKKKTVQVPVTFNHNYFFKVIRIILEGDHYQIMSRLLIIIYNYFSLFNHMAKYQIVMFLMGKVFFKLYYHWWKNIRNTFYLFLQIKIKHIKHQKSNDILKQYQKVTTLTRIIEKQEANKSIYYVQSSCPLYQKMKKKFYHKFKLANSECTVRSKGELSLQNLLKKLDDQIFLEQHPDISNLSEVVIATPNKARLSVQVAQNAPQVIKHSMSVTNLPNEPNFTKSTISSNFESHQNLQSKKPQASQVTSVRKKRRPSISILDGSPLTKYHSKKINNTLHDLVELSENQIRHIKVANIQMKQVRQRILQFALKNDGALPNNDILDIHQTQVKA